MLYYILQQYCTLNNHRLEMLQPGQLSIFTTLGDIAVVEPKLVI